MKEKLKNSLGVFGMVIWYVVSIVICVLPFVMIGASFWMNVLFFAIVQLFPSASIVFWIWGLVCAINGVQDAWAIAYYVLFAVGFIPFFASTVFDLFHSKR